MSKFRIEQEPWPLKKALDYLDRQDLGPYRVLAKHKIENEDTLEQLGTRDYIQWTLEDTEAPFESPVRRLMLFITYYELADRVPHVPEECYVGAGHQLLASEEINFRINRTSGQEEIQGRHLVFQKLRASFWGEGNKFSAFYLFNVNGRYAGSRDSARLALNRNMFAKHSYFSKVEWTFSSTNGLRSYLSKEEATRAGEKLLNVILPILEQQHWPREDEQDVASGPAAACEQVCSG